MRQKWPWVLVGGIIAFAFSDVALRSSGAPGMLTITLFIGAMVAPVTMVTFFYERIRDRDISVALLANGFIFGGAIGLAAAFLLESWTIARLGLGEIIAVGFIEEASKMIFPLLMYSMWRQRHQGDGLNFGVAAGMGFAALETMGYGMTALVENSGSIGAMEQLLLLRGVLSPAGHAAWTGMICAVLWRERERAGRVTINASVVMAFLLAVLLHIAWNVTSMLDLPEVLAVTGLLAVGAVSFGLLVTQYREARRTLQAVPASSLLA